MPTHYGHTPGALDADRIRRLATPSAVQRARGTTNLSAGRDPFAGRTLLSSGRSAGGAATFDNGETFAQYSKRVQAERNTARQASIAREAAARAPTDPRDRIDGIIRAGGQFDAASGTWFTGQAGQRVTYGNTGGLTPLDLLPPTRARQTTDLAQEPGPSAGRTLLSGGPGGGQATAPAPAPAPVAAQASPDVPQIGRIAPVRSTAPDPGSPATLARPEAPNVDPLTLPEARQRTVANRSQDLGHLQSARSRRSVQGPRGSFNMADTARRTLLGSL